jgi:hypothetical protein
MLKLGHVNLQPLVSRPARRLPWRRTRWARSLRATRDDDPAR